MSLTYFARYFGSLLKNGSNNNTKGLFISYSRCVVPVGCRTFILSCILVNRLSNAFLTFDKLFPNNSFTKHGFKIPSISLTYIGPIRSSFKVPGP